MDDYDPAEFWDEDDQPELLTNETAMEWASENREELKAMFDTGAYHAAVLSAHKNIYLLAEAELAKARKRLEEGEFAEAAFHASRTLEGYVRAVYLHPLAHVMTVGIAAGLKTGQELARKFVPNQVKDTSALLTLGLSVFFDDEAKVIQNRKIILSTFAPEGAWKNRNEVDHTLSPLDEDAAMEIVEHAEERLPKVAAVPIAICREREEAERARQQSPRALFADF